MPEFRFNRLEKYRVGGTEDRMELNIPLPQSPSGKISRWCPNDECSPRLFLLGDAHRPENINLAQFRRSPGTRGITCPYCGLDEDDDNFTYQGDIEDIQNYIGWAAQKDISDEFEKMTRDFNHSQSKGGLISLKMDFKTDNAPEPKAWREDLIRNLACDACGREYGVYAVALFCPDCGSKNLHVHFEREIELILAQIDLAEQMPEGSGGELSYRILGNAHEDVVTAFETYQKIFYKYRVRSTFPSEEAKALSSKKVVGNRFQNIDKAKELYKNISLDPFVVLAQDELDLMRLNIEKRHVIGHNLSMADEVYSDTQKQDKPDTTVAILGDEISAFAKTAKKVILELERLM